MTRLQDNSLPEERGMHSSTIPGASRERNYDFYKHNFLSSLPLALGGAQTPTALCHQPTVRSAHLSWPMHRGNEARALCGLGHWLPMPHQDGDLSGLLSTLTSFRHDLQFHWPMPGSKSSTLPYFPAHWG